MILQSDEAVHREARKWRPTLKQLETIATMGHARVAFDKITLSLGIASEVFCLWCKRVASARDEDE